MAAEMAAMLDELMGRNRNADPSNPQDLMSWESKEMCKYYLCGYCPHDLFTNTRVALGPCELLHDDNLRKDYQKSDKMGAMGYEQKWIRYLESIVKDMDRKIQRGNERLERNKSYQREKLAPSAQRQEEMENLSKKIGDLLTKAETLGSEGKVDEAKGVLKLCDQLKSDKWKLDDMGIEIPYSKEMEVCAICGAFLIMHDAEVRQREHLMGKQHMGYAQMRASIKDFYEKKQSAETAKQEKRQAEREAEQKAREERRAKLEKERAERERLKTRSRDSRRTRDSSRDRQRTRSRERRKSRERRRSRSHERRRRSPYSRRGGRRRSPSPGWVRSRSQRSRDRRRSNSRGRRRSRSGDNKPIRSRSRDKRRSGSRSGDKRRSGSRPGDKRRSRSRSEGKKSRSKSRDTRRSRSRSRNKRRSRSRSGDKQRSGSRSGDKRRSRSGSGDKKTHSKSRDTRRSRSRSADPKLAPELEKAATIKVGNGEPLKNTNELVSIPGASGWDSP